jgi:hypothetical protein
MKTKTPHSNRISKLSLALLLVAVPLATSALLLSTSPPRTDDFTVDPWGDLAGNAAGTAAVRKNDPGAIEAAFRLESYRPGSSATLRFYTTLRDVRLQVFHVGPEKARTVGSKEMQGIPVTSTISFERIRRGGHTTVTIGNWHSGLYFARLTAPRGRVGYAPFIVRPRHLGQRPVAVVLPTHTWQAYNFRDDDNDGHGDTWYATWGHRTALLGRPYLNCGVPPHFREYDLYFLRWLHSTGRDVDVLSQSDLDTIGDPRDLRDAYDLIVFPGHHEYVTTREYDLVEGYRDLGGSLIFLSANNYFWRVDIRGDVMTRVAQWRDLGRPESALIGVQYIGNDRGQHRGPWLVRSTAASAWVFAGTGSTVGKAFSNAGIEIDHTNSSSPRGTMVVAEIPNLLGPGKTGQMSYYETKRGAKVFAAGAFTLAGSIRQPAVARLVDNLWGRMADEA